MRASTGARKGEVQMRRKAITVLMLLAASAIVASSGASATETNPEWFVRKETLSEKKTLKAAEIEAVSGNITSTENWILKQAGGKEITVECPALKIEDPEIEGPKTFRSGSFVFTGCKVTAPASQKSCEVESTGQANGTIKTIAFGFSGTVGGTTTAPKITLSTGAEEITTLKLKGCTDEGSYAVDGSLTAAINTSAARKAHQWSFAGTKVKFGGQEATFAGTAEMVLTSGNEWGDV
jgi:hypothetical protein